MLVEFSERCAGHCEGLRVSHLAWWFPKNTLHERGVPMCCTPAPLQAQKHWAQLYRQVPPSVLEWSGRSGRCARLLAEIRRHKPDVMTLQEVDHMTHFEAGLSKLGCAPAGFEYPLMLSKLNLTAGF